MNERKEPGLNLSGLDVDERQPSARQTVSANTASSSVSAPQPAAKRGGGGGLLQTFILLLLTAACAGLGYWGVGLKQSLDQQQAALAKAQQRLDSVEQALALTSSSATQSGQTLMGRISHLESQATDKYKHFDSEIAKLWTVSYQRNKPQLEEQKKQLDSQDKTLSAQEKLIASQADEIKALKQQLADAEKTMAKSNKQIAGLVGDVKQVATLKQNLADLSKQLASTTERMKKQAADADFALSLERDDRTKALQALQGRVDKLETSRGEGDLSRRVASIEQSIRAIDGSRRQFNQSLLHVRQQLNNLQLKLEKAVGG